MRRRILSASLSLLVFCLTLWSQPPQKRAMTVDDILNLIGVSNAEISPDGKWIIFSRSALNWEENKRPSHLWIVSTEGGEPFQFTAQEGDSSPQWSPDSMTVAFLRGAGDSAGQRGAEPAGRQVWTIRLGGGEAMKLTDHQDGISSFRWSDDGKQIFFLANDLKTEAEKKKEKQGEDAIYVDEGPNGQTSRGRWSNLWVFNLADKKERQITNEQMIIGSYDPSPDGKRLAFHARRENRRNSGNLTEIYLVEVETGTVTRLTNNEAPESQVQWSPNGRQISYLAPDDKKWELAHGKLWLMDVETKAYRNLSAQFDSVIGEYVWTPDGRKLLFNGQQRTSRNLFELEVETGAVKRLTERPGVVNVDSFSADRKQAAAIYSSPQQPSDIWLVDVAANQWRQLTDVNPLVKDLVLAKSEVIKWKSKDGLEIEGILTLPTSYQPGTRVPLILHIHGGPAGSFVSNFSGIAQVYAGLGFAMIAPNVRGSTGYGDALLRGNLRDIGGGDYWDAMTGVDAVIERGIADPEKLAVKGWSYGGILGGWTLTQTKRFKAASLGAMVTDWSSEYGMGFNFDTRLWYIGGTPWENPEAYRKQSSYSFIKNVSTPTILFHGEQDTTCSIGQSMMFYQGLKDRGVPVRFLRFPREPHGFREPHHQRIRDVEEIAWLQKHINGIDWTSVRPEEKESKKIDGGNQ